MLIALHKNARTTPAVRAEIAASSETAPVLAQRYGITEQTVYKWKKREVFGDRSHTGAYFSDRGRLFQADRGRRIGVAVAALGKRAGTGVNVS